MRAENPQELKNVIQNIALLSWVALPGFDLLVRQARNSIDPSWEFTVTLRHHGPTTVGPLLERLKDDTNDFQMIRSNLIVMLMRATVADSFEAIRVYCETHNHMSFLRSQKWYHFARTIRNTFSHSGEITIESIKNEKDRQKEKKKILDSEWNGKRFEENMFGHPIQASFFDFDDAQLFIDDMSRFCDQLQECENQRKEI